MEPDGVAAASALGFALSRRRGGGGGAGGHRRAGRPLRQRRPKPAIERALADRPALIDAVVTPEAVSSDAKTSLAWVPDLQPLAAWDEAERRWRRGGG